MHFFYVCRTEQTEEVSPALISINSHFFLKFIGSPKQIVNCHGKECIGPQQIKSSQANPGISGDVSGENRDYALLKNGFRWNTIFKYGFIKIQLSTKWYSLQCHFLRFFLIKIILL